MKTSHFAHALLAAFSLVSPLHAQTPLDAGAKGVQRTVVTDSMIGYRDTILFYVFPEDKAVLVVRIGNGNLDFPVTAKLHTFAKGADAEGIEKWINNQHSDGLFPDVPEPEAAHEIPAASCTVEKHEFEKLAESHNGKFSTYSVTFRIKGTPALGDFKLKEFTDTAKVHVAIKAG